MTVDELISALIDYGYTVNLKGDNIVLKYTLQEEPVKEKVLSLINHLKQCKDEAVQYIRRTIQPVNIQSLLINLSINEREYFEERASILEHCGGFIKEEAEKEAMRIVSKIND